MRTGFATAPFCGEAEGMRSGMEDDLRIFRRTVCAGLLQPFGTPVNSGGILPIDRQRGAVSEPFEMIAARDAADEVELIAETEPVVGQKCVGALRSDGEEKFVVFAAGYGGFEIDGSRDALGIDFGTYAGLVQDMPQGCRMSICIRRSPSQMPSATCGGVAVDLCQRGVVPSGQDIAQSGARLSQRTADGDQVAGACVAAPFDMAVGDTPDGRYIDDQSRIRGCGVAPDQADVVLGREVAVAFHEIFDPSFGQVVRDSQRAGLRSGGRPSPRHRSD